MQIGKNLKNLRLKSGLTQEELGERTDLSKGYISQLERDLSSPSMDTFFSILEVLGCTPEKFFESGAAVQKVVYKEEDQYGYKDEEKGYSIQWLVPESNEKEMEPIRLLLKEKGEFKEFEPSSSETFGYVMKGSVSIRIGSRYYEACEGESIYFSAADTHQITNQHSGSSEILLVATHSYL
ncbi:helix-turn-helix domain-containing protein [Bacillus mangrovi]|uniref:Helix-turn-helix domain-containing protein n=1 Tax=Metabacillus mangrovi TaxID=1491830 RepID=A0A7X2S7S2_9BACI|nr:XRE family transcriptional regulator [Metabacillus mangrovi]MTH55209.1 helix-turn-helix domain-containing protein [Metabacillus mangrovi]